MSNNKELRSIVSDLEGLKISSTPTILKNSPKFAVTHTPFARPAALTSIPSHSRPFASSAGLDKALVNSSSHSQYSRVTLSRVSNISFDMDSADVPLPGLEPKAFEILPMEVMLPCHVYCRRVQRQRRSIKCWL